MREIFRNLQYFWCYYFNVTQFEAMSKGFLSFQVKYGVKSNSFVDL